MQHRSQPNSSNSNKANHLLALVGPREPPQGAAPSRVSQLCASKRTTGAYILSTPTTAVHGPSQPTAAVVEAGKPPKPSPYPVQCLSACQDAVFYKSS